MTQSQVVNVEILNKVRLNIADNDSDEEDLEDDKYISLF
jgi:hypothetical protein